jgi:hypothetical protein
MQIFLACRTASLGAVAAVLGDAGVNISRLESRRTEGSGATVTFLVELPDGCLPEVLVAECERLDGVRVTCITPYPSAGGLHYDLKAVQQMTAQPDQATTVLATAAPLIFHAHWGVVLRTARSICVAFSTPLTPPFVPVQLHLFAPFDVGHQLVLPDRWTDGQSHTAAVVAPVSRARAVVVGRANGERFSPADLARLEHLADLAGKLDSQTDDHVLRPRLLRHPQSGSSQSSAVVLVPDP